MKKEYCGFIELYSFEHRDSLCSTVEPIPIKFLYRYLSKTFEVGAKTIVIFKIRLK